MTTNSKTKFMEWLESEIAEAEKQTKGSSNFMRDGYSDGYVDGQVEALRAVRSYFTG